MKISIRPNAENISSRSYRKVSRKSERSIIAGVNHVPRNTRRYSRFYIDAGLRARSLSLYSYFREKLHRRSRRVWMCFLRERYKLRRTNAMFGKIRHWKTITRFCLSLVLSSRAILPLDAGEIQWIFSSSGLQGRRSVAIFLDKRRSEESKGAADNGLASKFPRGGKSGRSAESSDRRNRG